MNCMMHKYLHGMFFFPALWEKEKETLEIAQGQTLEGTQRSTTDGPLVVKVFYSRLSWYSLPVELKSNQATFFTVITQLWGCCDGKIIC